MAKCIMVQGTMSDVGKSILCGALCRIFKQDGYKVAPFKSQNMALNSYVTEDGFEMGRAQAMQAEAAGIKPDVAMNPILLKPNTNTGSQVIVMGEVLADISAREYYKMKDTLRGDIMNAYKKLDEEYDIIVIEGAGSPVELNLNKNDFVNMGMANMADAPVILVGDIDRGGVFAQSYGTVNLLDKEDRNRVKALVVNKFRGDISLFEDGIKMLSDITGISVAGVIPMMDIDIDDEDSLCRRFTKKKDKENALDIAVIKLPKISNFTDFNALDAMDIVNLRYVSNSNELGNPDILIIPGTKSTESDMEWIIESGLYGSICELYEHNVPIIGICGGYQILGNKLGDNHSGFGFLNIDTEFKQTKHRTNINGVITNASGIYEFLNGIKVAGYEIHMGESAFNEKNDINNYAITLENGLTDGAIKDNVFGTYLHGIFDNDEFRTAFVEHFAKKKGITFSPTYFDFKAYKESQYDKMADEVRKCLDMKMIYEIIGL